MSCFIRRILNLLFTFKIYSKHYQIIYNGKLTSFNKIWSSPSWQVRSKIKNDYAQIFSVLLMEAKVKVMQEFSLVTFYNTRHDCDNLSMIAKVLVDCMKDRYVVDDTNSVYKSTHTIFDPKLPRGVVEFHLIGK